MKFSVPRGLFYAFIVWAPVPIGSNRPVLWAVNAVLVLIVFILLMVDEVRGPRRNPVARRIVAAILGATLVPLGWMLIQAVRWTPQILHAPEWASVGTGGAISVSPGATLIAAGAFVTVALSGAIAARMATSTRRAKMLLYMVLLSSGLVAGWGFLSMSLGLSQNLLAESGSSVLTSFFVNRNTAATYIGFGLVVSVALMTSRMSAAGPERLAAVIADLPRRAAIPLLLIASFALALLATGSRAGVAAGVIGASVTFIIGSRRASLAARWSMATVFVLVSLLVFLGASSDTLFARLGDLDLANDARWQLYRDTIAAIASRPLLGYGAGTFADFFPSFHSDALPAAGIWLEAHNTYLQSAAELGLPIFVAAFALLLVAVGRTIATAWGGRDTMAGSVAASGAAIVIAIHAMFDFSLQVQAVAIAFAVLVGIGLAAPGRLASRRSQSEAAPVVEHGYEGFNVIPDPPSASS